MKQLQIKSASAYFLGTLVLSNTHAIADDTRQWIYLRDKKSVVFGTPNTGDLLVEFKCVRKNKISNMWALNNDTRRFKNGQSIQIDTVPDEKSFHGNLVIDGKVKYDRDADHWWMVATSHANADSILFKHLRWSTPIRARGTGMTYDLTSVGIANIERLQSACSPD